MKVASLRTENRSAFGSKNDGLGAGHVAVTFGFDIFLIGFQADAGFAEIQGFPPSNGAIKREGALRPM